MKNNNEILLSIGFKEEEEENLINNKNIEELIVLLSSLHIMNLKRYILKNKYLLDYNIYDLSYIISKTFNEKKNYCIVKRILTRNKYILNNKKGDVK
ncbi:hypothetical protein [uncultured Parabacteroides sp.]|uniref:hypothetical protein n=1 Tax=uncultured Parabacteroides sp. TaxID=512312 RepID=UPI00259BB760|nr:hypothetical protein [uncultured Parabacteroides sp.]